MVGSGERISLACRQPPTCRVFTGGERGQGLSSRELSGLRRALIPSRGATLSRPHLAQSPQGTTSQYHHTVGSAFRDRIWGLRRNAQQTLLCLASFIPHYVYGNCPQRPSPIASNMSQHPVVGTRRDTFTRAPLVPLDRLPNCFLFFVITKSIGILKKSGTCAPVSTG